MKNGFKIWAKAAGIRAAKTVAQTAISVIGVSAALRNKYIFKASEYYVI